MNVVKGNNRPLPPQAEERPHVHQLHDNLRKDPWFWMRERDDPVLQAHLEAENEYTDKCTVHNRPLQEALYRDMLACIADEDRSAPWRRDEYYYYRYTRRDRAYPIYCRKFQSLEATEEVILDQNRLAENLPYCDLGVFELSPDHRLLAFSIDDSGAELYRLQFKDLAGAGLIKTGTIPDTCASLAWANDNRTVFYTTADATRRPYRLYRYRVGDDPSAAELVYEEDDPSFYLSVERGLDGVCILASLHSKSSSEVLALPAERPHEAPRIVRPRAPGVEYHAAHHGGYFYLLTNREAPNFKVERLRSEAVFSGSEDVPAGADADPGGDPQTVIAHRGDVTLEGMNLFAKHMVLHERYDGLPRVRVRGFNGTVDHHLQFGESLYEAWQDHNEEFDTPVFRCGFSSPVTPYTVYDFDLDSGHRTLVKRTPVLGGFRSSDYRCERLFGRASDGARVPISVVYPATARHGQAQPLLLLGYGSYGLNYQVSFSRTRLALLERGVTIAIAHVRGGGEMGRSWYEDGKLLSKRNSFTDFICCAEHLVREGWTTPGQLAIQGASAGGLLVAAAVNLRPQLFRAVVADVPFVDVLTTILDDTLPLSVTEREEWGNPQQRRFYEYIKSYSPYDNVKKSPYPAMLVTAGLNDPRVAYWEPVKWVARLRRSTTSKRPVLLRCHGGAGHGGPSGVYNRLREKAFAFAFILTQLGLDGISGPLQKSTAAGSDSNGA